MIQCSTKGKWIAHGIHIALFWFTCIILKSLKKKPKQKVLAERKKNHKKWIELQNKTNSINSIYYFTKEYRILDMLPKHFKKQVNNAQVTDNTAALSSGFILNLIYLIQKAQP